MCITTDAVVRISTAKSTLFTRIFSLVRIGIGMLTMHFNIKFQNADDVLQKFG